MQVMEDGEAYGGPYLALEYVDGGSLDQQLGGKPRPPAEAAALVETLARAVHAAHLRGIVHRDLKPANVLLSRRVPESASPRVLESPSRRVPESPSQDRGGLG